MSDPISDMITRLRNALQARQASIRMPHSKLKEAIAAILKQHGFIAGYSVEQEGFKTLTLELDPGEPKITQVSRISKPSRRIYAASRDIPRVLGGRGLVIISTSNGLMTGHEASNQGLGGELICKIW
jgi:small subunit ribosomal protein S8